ncbi:MAG: tRNA pseudouridine(54/55) synthase Pus10 [Thermoplasmata archaeon]
MSPESEIFDPKDERVRRVIGALKTRDLCDHCLGRLLGKIGHGYSNDQRGRLIRETMGLGEVKTEDCRLCEGLFNRLDDFAISVKNKIDSVSCRTFAVGSRYDPAIIEREESIWSECGSEFAEPIKVEMNREIGKRVEKLTGKVVDTKNPDVTAIIDVNFLQVDLEISSIFVYGRYLKHDRTIPQTRWPCRRCKGKGCQRCNFTGKMYQESVEELIRKEFMIAAEAEESALHGMGREDIDARMLGNGRPFVLELKRPKKRDIDLANLEQATNRANEGRVQISNLRISSKDEVRIIKEAEPEKSYRVMVEFSEPVSYAKLLNALDSLRQVPIEQRTPTRVSHRRADKVRTRFVKEIELEGLNANTATIAIRTSSGTYIKELIHGDEGRTKPSLAELLAVNVSVRQLDVIGVHHDEGEADGQGIQGN